MLTAPTTGRPACPATAPRLVPEKRATEAVMIADRAARRRSCRAPSRSGPPYPSGVPGRNAPNRDDAASRATSPGVRPAARAPATARRRRGRGPAARRRARLSRMRQDRRRSSPRARGPVTLPPRAGARRHAATSARPAARLGRGRVVGRARGWRRCPPGRGAATPREQRDDRVELLGPDAGAAHARVELEVDRQGLARSRATPRRRPAPARRS